MALDIRRVRHDELTDLVGKAAGLRRVTAAKVLRAVMKVIRGLVIEGNSVQLLGIGELEMELFRMKRKRLGPEDCPAIIMKMWVKGTRSTKGALKRDSKLIALLREAMKLDSRFNPRNYRWWSLPTDQAREVFVKRRMRDGSTRKAAERHWESKMKYLHRLGHLHYEGASQ